MSIGNTIKEARAKKGITQTELAENTGFSRSYIADVEADRYNPSLKCMTAIAKELRINLNFLTKNDGKTRD